MSTVAIASALAAGVLFSAFYFGGLWATVRRAPTMRHPEVCLLVSGLVRTAVVLVGFYFAMGGRWERAVAFLFGFMLTRGLLVRVVRSSSAAIHTR
jgi:F1F0 ATPase subunit 2